MGNNYKAWHVDEKQFSSQYSIENKIKFILNYAVLAPSGHNTQPWYFKIKNNLLEIYIESTRSLPKSDPKMRQLLISLGCLIENLNIASNHFGLNLDISTSNNINFKEPVFIVNFSEKYPGEPDNENLFRSITLRHTNRFEYKNISIKKIILPFISKIQNHFVKIYHVSNDIELTSKIMSSQIEIMDSADFRLELSELMLPNFSNKNFGMIGKSFGVPTIPSIFAKFMIKKLNMSRINKKSEGEIISSTSDFIVICGINDENNNWIESGKVFERIWLKATSDGLAISPLASLIASEKYRFWLQNRIKTDYRPHVFFRVGYPTKQSCLAPRFKIEDLIK